MKLQQIKIKIYLYFLNILITFMTCRNPSIFKFTFIKVLKIIKLISGGFRIFMGLWGRYTNIHIHT